jgi:hypothetical protein
MYFMYADSKNLSTSTMPSAKGLKSPANIPQALQNRNIRALNQFTESLLLEVQDGPQFCFANRFQLLSK